MPRRPVVSAAAALLIAAAGACGTGADADSDATPASLEVVAAFYPLEFVAGRVGGEHTAITGLAPPGVDAHDLELTPRQVADVEAADLVIYLDGFQPAVDDTVTAHAGEAFDVTEAVPLLETGTDGHSDGAEHADEETHEDEAEHADEETHEDEAEHADEETHEDEAEHADEESHEGDESHEGEEHAEEDDDHGHGPQDPHVWLDPQRMASIAGELAERFGVLDPDHAADYTANAEDLQAELAELDTEFTDGLGSCERREIVVSHAAFGYLTDRYDLRQIAITGLSPEDEPSPQRLDEVIHEAGEVGATTIFFEVLVSPDVAEVIAREVGAETAVLDPIEGLAPDSEDDYVSLMRQNLDTLQTALDCA